MLTILFYIFIAVIFIQILHYTILYGNIAFGSSNSQKSSEIIPVSILVYIKDQENNLPAFLPALLNQEHPKFEIILINNASEDNSLEIIESFAAGNPKIKIVNVINNEAFWGNKKYALTLGIKVASFNQLLFIEPDALPSSPFWALEMSQKFSSSKGVILGHTQIRKTPKSFISQLLRYQNTFKSTDLFAWSHFGKPIHGNARNQGYKKDLFYKVNGFIREMKIPYGDEYAFIEEIGTKKNTAEAISANSFTVMDIPNTFSTWKEMLKTNNLLLKSSKIGHRIKIRFFNFIQLSFFILSAVLLSFLYQWEVVLALFLFRYLIVYFYNNKLFKIFNNKDLIWTLPFLEIIHIFTVSYYSLIHFISRKKI